MSAQLCWKIDGNGAVGGRITVPGDKSISHRSLLFSALADGSSRIVGLSRGEDCVATANALRRLGVSISDVGEQTVVRGCGIKGLTSNGHVELDCGNSGTTMRLMLGVLAGQPGVVATLTGDESLSRRPMGRVVEPLSRMGAHVRALGPSQRPPVEIRGAALHGAEHWTDVASAQVKSALLLAGLLADGRTSVCEPSQSRDHTERMLQSRGVVVHRDGRKVSVAGGQSILPQDIAIPGDLSAASFFWVLGAILSDSGVYVNNVGINPTRTGIVDVLATTGAAVEISDVITEGGEPAAVIGVRRSHLSAFEIGGVLVPRLVDEIPVLSVLATQATGETVIRDAAELRVKESDRISAIYEMLVRMGASVSEEEAGLRIVGPCVLKGTEIDSHGDHRIAMAGAVAALAASGTTLIRNVECVDTSFPGFLQCLRSVAPGARIDSFWG
ncbi:MAG: 3-phosphoshikimate 1-carboxyvinyltransferase [Myxococcales bacterium]|nr:3-phosphoshikimate 1-carboxyvinyltransferase [Myxococcales bacterium]